MGGMLVRHFSTEGEPNGAWKEAEWQEFAIPAAALHHIKAEGAPLTLQQVQIERVAKNAKCCKYPRQRRYISMGWVRWSTLSANPIVADGCVRHAFRSTTGASRFLQRAVALGAASHISM